MKKPVETKKTVDLRISDDGEAYAHRWRVEISLHEGGVCIGIENDGVEWTMGFLTKEGTLRLAESVPRNIGFQVDKDGYLVVERGY